MSEEFMCCNLKNCRSAITRVAWVTRCSHAFCDEHGESNFLPTGISSTRVKCPACNETLHRDTDVTRVDLNPSDLTLCLVQPDKAIDYVTRAFKLWSYQMQLKRRAHIDEIVQKYEGLSIQSTMHLEAQNKKLKRCVEELDRRLKKLSDDLIVAKQRYRKYKAAYLTTQMPMNNQPIATPSGDSVASPSWLADSRTHSNRNLSWSTLRYIMSWHPTIPPLKNFYHTGGGPVRS